MRWGQAIRSRRWSRWTMPSMRRAFRPGPALGSAGGFSWVAPKGGRDGRLASDRQDERVFRARRIGLIGRQRLEALVEQLRRAKPSQLELTEPTLVIGAPGLAHIEGADEQIAVTLEQEVRRKLDLGAVVASRHRTLAGDGLHHGKAGFVHDSSSGRGEPALSATPDVVSRP